MINHSKTEDEYLVCALRFLYSVGHVVEPDHWGDLSAASLEDVDAKIEGRVISRVGLLGSNRIVLRIVCVKFDILVKERYFVPFGKLRALESI
jgi:hypothetical protein